MKHFSPLILGLFGWSALAGFAYADEKSVDLGVVDVIGVTPLQGSNVPVEKIPAHIQTVSSEQLQQAQSISLADYINQYLGSVDVNEAQNNPLQPDIYYRGFVASPLLGLPQGLSTYVNGVRFNEAFGDSVNWDLIPEGAIESMELYPGSNPVYGLNTLGGAISIKTKTGFSAPKHELEVYGGSWGRHSEEITSGANNGTWGYFIDLHHFSEEGWRDFSPTEAKQALGSLSWRGDKGSLDLTLATNDNDLRGNGATPIQLLEQDRSAVFTHPDQSITRLFFSELAGSYSLTDNIELSGNTYFRQNRIRTFNGDDSDYDECANGSGFLCEEGEDEPVIDTNGNPVLADDSVEGATNNTSSTNMYSRGGTLQSAFLGNLFQHENSLTVGASYDYATVHFAADTELASLTADRGTVGSGVYVDASKVRLHTHTETYGLFITDSFSITDQLTATLAGRYNNIHIDMQDKYVNDVKTLDGSHGFDRFNPSAGLTYEFNKSLSVYGSYSESARVPSPMELSCADPEAPCKLPNAFVADPPLEQVVANTWETGLRGDFAPFKNDSQLKWNLGFFHTINHNDIIFRRDASSGIISQGYFDNVGDTRRMGMEAGSTLTYPQLFSTIDDWHLSTNYTYLDATFQNGFETLNPLDDTSVLQVKAGDRIPGIAEHLFKAALGVELWQRFSIGITGIYSGDKIFRGDEANSTAPLAGYWLFNGTAEYKVTENFSVFGKVNNIFDTRYNTFGVYGQADQVLGGAYNDSRFLSPGAPQAGWVGVRLTM
ncbi:TonB-dependent receptor [Methylosoma difficile]